MKIKRYIWLLDIFLKKILKYYNYLLNKILKRRIII